MAEESSPVNVLDVVVALEEHQGGLQELNGIPGTRRTGSRQQSLSKTQKEVFVLFVENKIWGAFCGRVNVPCISVAGRI